MTEDELRISRFLRKLTDAIPGLINSAERGYLETEGFLGTKKLSNGTTADLKLVMTGLTPAYIAKLPVLKFLI